MSDVQVLMLLSAIYLSPHADKKLGYVLGSLSCLLGIVHIFI